MSARFFRQFAIATLLLPLTVAAQTLYTSPNHRFTLELPSGWQVQPEPDLSEVTFRNGAISVSVLVSQQHKSNAMTAQEFIDGNISELKGQCPTFRNRKTGPGTLAGFAAVTSISTCSGARSPAVAEDSATLTPEDALIGFTVISPLARYYEMLPILDGMRSSLRIDGHPAPATPVPAESEASIALDKACMVGAFSQEECGRRRGMLIDQQHAGPDTHLPNLYRDPAGRFSIEYPADWKAISEGNNGDSGVQLRSGSYWINLMPETAASPSELVLQREQQMAARVNSTRTPPFGRAGLIQLFGHGLEITVDNFSAASPAGDPIDSYVAGVGEISGGGNKLLLIIASLPRSSPKDGAVVPFFSIAQSIRLGSGVDAATAMH